MKNLLFCSSLVVLTLNINAQTVIDIDGNIYNTVNIGAQTWMKENLRTTKYNDNTSITHVPDNSAWDGLSTLGYCWYNNDQDSIGKIYGALYNWYAVSTTTNGGKNICPSGWHVPTDEEWKQLEMLLGMSQADADNTGRRGTIEGGKLKESGTTHWFDPNTGGTNESDFTALPGGYRHSLGNFYVLGSNGYWWSSTEASECCAWGRNLVYNKGSIERSNNNRTAGFSLRCMKDNNTSTSFTPNSEEEIIYPNPAYEKIYLNLIDNLKGSINIFDIQGKQVLFKHIDSDPIDISNLKNGLYIMKLVKSDGIIINKFLKE